MNLFKVKCPAAANLGDTGTKRILAKSHSMEPTKPTAAEYSHVLSVWQRHGTRSIRGFLEAAELSNRVEPNTRLLQIDQMGHFAIEFDSSATFFEFIHLNRK